MDFACVYRWVSDTLSGQTRKCTKASSEMLIRHCVATLRELAAEYELDINVGLVKSHDNWADQLIRVPQWWLEEICTVAGPKETVFTVAEKLDVAHVEAIHQFRRHPGVKRMLYFVKLVNPKVPREAMQVE